MPPWEEDWQLARPSLSLVAPDEAPDETPAPDIVPVSERSANEDRHAPVSEQPEATSIATPPAGGADQAVPPEPDAADGFTASVEELPDWDDLAIPDEEEIEITHLTIPTLPGLSHVELVQRIPAGEEADSLPLVASALPSDSPTPLSTPAATPPEATSPAGPTPVINPPARRPAGTDPTSERPVGRPIGLPPYLVSPTPPVEQQGEARMVTVVLRSSGDKTRDVLRLRRIHGILMSYPGEDRFALQVYERGRFYLLEFPNFSCGICQELVDRLAPLVGRENLRVETLRYQ